MKKLIFIMSALALPLTANAQTAPAQTDIAKAAPAATKTASADKTGAAKERMICRRVEVTGSLVKRGKVCKSSSEWARIIERGNDNARRTLESGMACAGGPSCNGGM